MSRFTWKAGDLRPYDGAVRKTMPVPGTTRESTATLDRMTSRLREDYNPDEPRDEHGMWTSGGDSGGVTKDPTTGVPDHTGAIVADIQSRRLSDSEAAAAIRNGTIADTLTRNSTNGVLNEDRLPVKESGIAAGLDDHAAQQNPQAVFTAGAGASGKTGLYSNPDQGLAAPQDTVIVNPDEFKTGLDVYGNPMPGYLGIPEFQGLNNAGYPEAASAAVHEESSNIAAGLRDAAMSNQTNIVVDGVGGSGSKFASVGGDQVNGKINDALAAGYDTQVRVATVPVQTSIDAATARAQDPTSPSFGRAVPADLIAAQHVGVGQTYVNNVVNLAGRVASQQGGPSLTVGVWERNGGTYNPLSYIDASGQSHVYDQQGYDQFLARSQGHD